ncbi:2-dehydropantoate 2-reductase N-terminal domain-containing protein, partial [Streptococcus suis]
MQGSDATRDADVMILLTMADQLATMWRDIKPIIVAPTKVLCLLYGLGIECYLVLYVHDEIIMVVVIMLFEVLMGPG